MLGHNQGPSMNRNIEALRNGMKFRLEIFGARLMRSEPEFAVTKAAASRRRTQLKESGYNVRIFEITEDGGLR